jgi:acyl-CoA synthetase (AMP-forming)/AMP-acid ligase II
MTFADLLEANAEKYGDHTGYVQGERILTHRQYLNRARQLANALHQRSARWQDRIAMLSMNSMEYLEVYGACEVAAFIIATVNYRLSPAEMVKILADAAPTVLIFEAQYAQIVAEMRTRLPSIKSYLCIGNGPEWAESYELAVASGRLEAPPSTRPRPKDLAHLIYTSGTTGQPKGCMLAHQALVSKAQLHAGDMGTVPDDRLLIVMPLFHVGSRGIVSAGQWRGATIYLLRSFEPSAFLRTLEQEKITIAHLAPTMVKDVLEHESVEMLDLSSLRVMCYAASPMPLPTLRRGLEVLGRVFHQSYGQTEGMISSLLRSQHSLDGNDVESARLQSAGQPYPGTQVRIVDESGNNLPQGAIGEIVYRGPCTFSGYWNDSVKTFETMREGWIYSGDIGRYDTDGFLYVVDRKKDMIISGGENIYSREVEEALLSHAAVHEAAVIGVPDAKWGEAVHAFVSCKEGLALSESALIEHCRQQIASYKKPRSVTFVPSLPRLVNGKVNKMELRAWHAPSRS